MTFVDTLDPEKVQRVIEDKGDRLLERYGVSDVRFALWLMLVDRRMLRAVGVTHRDIGDWGWWDAYEGGESPKEAVAGALADDDTYGPHVDLILGSRADG